jgi:hypothetical protein
MTFFKMQVFKVEVKMDLLRRNAIRLARRDMVGASWTPIAQPPST